eukprot:COSAG01_NODE_552_length_15569_cov_37.676123_6_plen_182_part_00
MTVGPRPRTLPVPSQLTAPEGRGDGYQHPLSGAGARRQGAWGGGGALECTCAELAHPQGARRQALFRRLSDPVRRDILPLRVRRRQQAKAGAGATCWCAAAVLPADLCGCGARAEPWKHLHGRTQGADRDGWAQVICGGSPGAPWLPASAWRAAGPGGCSCSSPFASRRALGPCWSARGGT